MTERKCTPYADDRPCNTRSVLDGEVWCDTHECYGFRPREWREWEREQAKGGAVGQIRLDSLQREWNELDAQVVSWQDEIVFARQRMKEIEAEMARIGGKP